MNLEQRLLQMEVEVRSLRLQVERLTALVATVKLNSVNEGLLSVKEVCQEFDIGASLIYDGCAKGEIPFEKRRKHYKFKRADIVEWIAKMQVPAVPKVNVEDYVTNYLQKNPLRR